MSCNTYLKRLQPKSIVIIHRRESVMFGTVHDGPHGIQVHLNVASQVRSQVKGSETSGDFREGKTDSKVSDEIKVSCYNNGQSVEISRNNKGGFNRKYHTPSSKHP